MSAKRTNARLNGRRPVNNLKIGVRQADSPRRLIVEHVARIATLVGIFFLAACATPKAPSLAGACPPGSSSCNDATRISLFFATNRALIQSEQGQTDFGLDRSYSLTFGRLFVDVPPTSVRSVGSIESDFRIAGTEVFSGESDFIRALRAEIAHRNARGQPGSPLIFVHGYAESFPRAAYRNAQIVVDARLTVVPILFAWPSRDSPVDYAYDRESATFSRDALLDVINAVRKASGSAPPDLLAHSMGNWVAIEAIAGIPGSSSPRSGHKIGALVLASPDVDIDVFSKDLPRAVSGANDTLLMTSRNDVLLGLSEFLAHGVSRTGNASQRELSDHHVRSTPHFAIFDMDGPGGDGCSPFDHHCAESTPAMLEVIREFLNEKTSRFAEAQR
jgi:esterase/lipase superfamily enzyme